MHRARARPVVFQPTRFAALIPAPRAALSELEVAAGATVLPARLGRAIDQSEQAGLGGRVDAARDRAT